MRCFWVYEGQASEAEPYIYRGYADGCAEVVFHHRGVYDLLVGNEREKTFTAGIHAQTRTFSRCIINQNFWQRGPRIRGAMLATSDAIEHVSILSAFLEKRLDLNLRG